MTRRGPTEQVAMQHVLEIRLKTRLFSFTDIQGRMIQKMASDFGLSKVQFRGDGTRFDLADTDFSRLYFVSFENFGFQLDAQTDLSVIVPEAEKLLAELKLFPDYVWKEGLIRIGTRSSILLHRPNDSFEALKKSFQDKMINNSQQIGTLTSSEITDTAYHFDLKLGDKVANVLCGPVTFDEAINRFLGKDRKNLYRNVFDKNSGLFFSIDVASLEQSLITDADALLERLKVHVSDLEKIYSGFKTFLQPSQ